MELNEIKYDSSKKCFVYCEEPEKEFEVKNRDDDEYDDEDDLS